MGGSAVCVVGRLTKLAISVHEAGHAVAGIALDCGEVQRAWIERVPRGWSGFVWRRSWCEFDPDKQARIALAGPIAEHVWAVRTGDPWADVAGFAGEYARVCFKWPDGSVPDFDKAREHIAETGATDPEAAFLVMWHETSDLLRRNWASVVRLGRALKDVESLDGPEVLRVVGDLA
jgi:hypothetical protein